MAAAHPAPNAAAERNVISGGTMGVYVLGSGASSNTIKNNYVGTDPTGTLARRARRGPWRASGVPPGWPRGRGCRSSRCPSSQASLCRP